MPITEEVQLPEFSELDIQDVNISQPALVSAGIYFGQYCDQQSKEYMLCRLEERDPRKCLAEGKAVTMCGHEFFRKVGQTCKDEVEKMAKCMEWTHKELRFVHCYKEKKILQNCMEAKLGITKPPFGYFSQLRVHESERPKPKSYAIDFQQPTPGLTEEFEKKSEESLGKKNPHYIVI